MRKLLLLSIFWSSCLHAQMLQMISNPPQPSGFTPITLDGSGCTGTGSSKTIIACSSPLTVTAGDTIYVACYNNNGSFDPGNVVANDTVNGFYGAIRGGSHPSSSDDWVSTFVYENSASGSITPQCQSWEPNGWGIFAQAIKGTPTSFVVDGGAVNLSRSATAANPTAGTAASPTNANEIVLCQMVRASAATTSAGSGFSPAGTLTGVTNSLAQYFEYQIQTTATAVNCPYTSASAAFLDNQGALLNASSTGGFKALTGVYGAPAAAQTNGASATTTILNTNSGSLTPLASPSGTPWSLLSGSATTFDTSVAPLGTLKLITNGVGHTVGDAATSIKVPTGNTTTAYNYGVEGLQSNGQGEWLASFFRVGTNATANTLCDTWNVDETLVEADFTTQIDMNGSNAITFLFERQSGAIPSEPNLTPSPALTKGQDYLQITHVAGIDEANNELFIFYEATPGTLPWILHDHFSTPKGGPVIATPTATGTSGATSFTVSSATGIVVGQAVYSATGSVDTGQIPHGAKVASIVGTTISIAPTTLTGNMIATPVEFAGPVAATTASTTAGSTTLTVASGTGLVSGASLSAGAQLIGMAGVQAGTFLLSGSGTSWVMSQPATLTEISGTPVQFWGPNGNSFGFHFGKFSSCTSTADMWFSAMTFDPYGTILPLVASGAISW
jgi:hypothetical protein